jgi:hypothetical protein
VTLFEGILWAVLIALAVGGAFWVRHLWSIRGSGRLAVADWREKFRSLFGVGLFGALLLLGLAAVASYAPTLAGAGLAAALAVVGVLLGFLFGIPRTLQSDAPVEGAAIVEGTAAPTGAAPAVPAPTQALVYRINSNLEQISDWLTKTLVGLGLTQLTTAPDRLREMGAYFAPALGGAAEVAERVAVVAIIYFLVCGFLFGYLWTRLFLASAFKWADANIVQDIRRHLGREPTGAGASGGTGEADGGTGVTDSGGPAR